MNFSSSREKSTPFTQTQMATNTTIINKAGQDVGKRLFESGTYKDPRLIYDVSIIYLIHISYTQMFLF
jgi:hypothetical protein